MNLSPGLLITIFYRTRKKYKNYKLCNPVFIKKFTFLIYKRTIIDKLRMRF